MERLRGNILTEKMLRMMVWRTKASPMTQPSNMWSAGVTKPGVHPSVQFYILHFMYRSHGLREF